MAAQLEFLQFTNGGWYLRFRVPEDVLFRATVAGVKALPLWARYWDPLALEGRGAWWVNYSCLEQIGSLFSNYQTMRDQVEASYRQAYQQQEQARQAHQAHTDEQQEQAHQTHTNEQQHHARQHRRRQPKKKQPPPNELLRLPETCQEAFTILHLPLLASLQEIKQAYRRQALQAHPDRGGSHAAMVILNRAYELAQEKGAGHS